MVRRYQIRLMRSVNARCVSIGLVLALSNCSESGGEPDAMLDMHHPGTGIDSHHPQFHNSYGNMKFIIIVINPTLGAGLSSARLKDNRDRFARSCSRSQRFSSPRRFSRRVFLSARPSCPFVFDAEHPSPTTRRQTSFAFGLPRTSSTKRLEKGGSRPRPRRRIILPFFLFSPFDIINKRFSLLNFRFHCCTLFRISHFH